ncbi:glycosyltransferase family 2 protein [Endozoicomonas acroporae]|uniref:glycosyltransferase family 2 protein n=1 Tax=Endozoicomonas acroporae TaxID=1701104 RepID=UPI003D7A8F91
MSVIEKLVSIIIPAYNVDAHIEKCLLSCLRQTYKNIEVIVVNDGSTDNTLSIIGKVKLQYPKLIVIDQKNKGLTATRKVGLAAVTGHYILHVDGDDFLPLNALEVLYNKAAQTSADITCGKTCRVYLDRVEQNDCKSIRFDCIDGSKFIELVYEGIGNNIWGKLIKRSLYHDNEIIVPDDIVVGEDYFALIQLVAHSKAVAYEDTVVYNYLYRPSSIMGDLKVDYKRILKFALTLDSTLNRISSYYNDKAISLMIKHKLYDILRASHYLDDYEEEKINYILNRDFYNNKKRRGNIFRLDKRLFISLQINRFSPKVSYLFDCFCNAIIRLSSKIKSLLKW